MKTVNISYKKIRQLLYCIIMIGMFILNCGPKVSTIEIGGYGFMYDEVEYRIESVTPNFSEGYNMLLRKENEKLIFKAVDKQQDGVLDDIVIGNLSLKEADAIYRMGIKEGEKRGYIKKRTFAREYRTSDTMNNYIIATYILAMGEIYNKFIITDRQIFFKESIVHDLEADGKIDEVEKGLETMGHYQKLYQNIIKKGMSEKKIKKQNGKYIVVF